MAMSVHLPIASPAAVPPVTHPGSSSDPSDQAGRQTWQLSPARDQDHHRFWFVGAIDYFCASVCKRLDACMLEMHACQDASENLSPIRPTAICKTVISLGQSTSRLMGQWSVSARMHICTCACAHKALHAGCPASHRICLHLPRMKHHLEPGMPCSVQRITPCAPLTHHGVTCSYKDRPLPQHVEAG